MDNLLIKLNFVLVIGFFSSLVPAADPLHDYWGLSEYLTTHPEQIPLSIAFSAQVQLPAHPTIFRAKQPLKVAIVFPAEQVSDYWRRNILAFESRMTELAIPYQLEPFFTKPSLEPREQSRNLFEALKSDPDYLIFTLDTLRHKKFIERVVSKGRPKIILQNITTPLKAWQDKQPFFYVGFDHATGSWMLADYYKAAFPRSADYGMLYFSKGYVSAARGDTFIDAMQSAEAIKLKTSYYTKANRESAYQAALSTLREYPNLDFFYACSTDVALGAVDAIKQLGLQNKVRVNGWGGGSAELEAIENADLDVTVMRMNDDTGVAMAEAIKLDQQSRPVPLVYSGELVLVTKGISKGRLNTLKHRAFRYSDQ
ncbi:substrate-binding domain-containing protein [Photobacterium sagamiensis]|uniref:substrate-binding domain-containing protein n=1 Tax=Photobacterium sagamiensis TaxID=2910241 RepID=UPI003D12691A